MSRADTREGAPRDIWDRRVVTVMKADISGSTPLAEKLDPEDLRLVLGTYFAALAREIHRRGGVIDKYIGDAVIAVFGIPEPLDDDAERAVVAGVAMQEAIERENVELARRYGVTLACRIGIATGEVISGAIAEEIQAAYTVVGAPVALAEALESAASLGSVLVSPATSEAAREGIRVGDVELVLPKGATERIPAYRVLGLRRQARVTEKIARAMTSASLQVASDRAHVLAEERKIVTVLFADISASEPLGTKLDAAELRSVLGDYFGVIARVIQRYGGTIDKYIGDAVMAVFGAPISHEDDGARAIAAGLGIKQAIARQNEELERRYGLRLSVRIGINTGEVVAGLLPGEVVAYTVTGDAVNTAQRIESVAPANEILVSETTRALARNAFVYEAVPPLTLKGKSAPVAAFKVLRRERRASPRGGTTLVGREAELAALYAAFREATAGRGTAVHVWGEPGVGKTRLIGEFLSGVHTTVRVRARASSYEQATPYALVADVIRAMFALSDATDEATARTAVRVGTAPIEPETRDAAITVLLEILGFDVRSPLDGEAKRRLLLAVLRRLAQAIAEERPLVLVVEDLHWSDATSLDVIAELARDVGALRWMLLSTSREPADARWASTVVGLEALPLAAAAELVDRLAPTVDAATRTTILERTGGNPFFIEEVVRSLTDGAAAVPATIQDLLEARLDALDAEPRRVARAAAVVGRTFWTRVVAEVVPDVELQPALATLERGHFVSETARKPEHTYSFAHALVQEVAYRTQLLAERRRSHVVVGDTYSTLFGDRLDEFVDTLAFHYRRGNDDPKARAWLMRAGHRAQRLYANAEALDYFRAAIERSADDALLRAEAEEALGDVQRVLARYDEALARYAAARSALPADAAVDRARLSRKTALVHQTRGKTDEALSLIEEALAALPPEARAERARALLAAADASFRAGRHDDAIARAREARVEAERAQDEEALAEALKQLGTLFAYRGELAEALRHQHESLAAYERIGDALGQANLHNNIGRSERRRSHHDAALAAYREALAIRERIGDQLGRIHSHGNIAEIHFLRGELREARGEYEAVLGLSEAIGYAFGVSAARVGLGATKAAEGDAAGAIADLAAAIDDFERTGQRTYTVEALRDLTDAYVVAGSPDAIATAQRAVAVAREMALGGLVAIALQALGKARLAAGDATGAAAALEESRELLGATGDRHELGRTLGLLGRAYGRLPADDPRSGQAARLTDDARAILEELGAALDLRRLGGG